MVYRVGVIVFAVLLFLRRGNTRTILSIGTIPCAFALFSTAVFVSTDILRQLARCYEFWFLVTINALNWTVLAFILNDMRALLCFSAWLAFQTVIMIDANYRTYPTALSSTIVSSPLIAVIAALVAARRIRDAHYFEVRLHNYVVGDAADFISFTSSTLVFFLVRIVVLKKTRTHRTVSGFKSIPCVVIKATLRLVPLDADDQRHHRHGISASPGNRIRLHKQGLILSSLPLKYIDARRTVLPHDVWKQPPRWIKSHAQLLRGLFYFTGVLALGLLSVHTLAMLWFDWKASHSNDSRRPRSFGAVTPWSWLVVSVGSFLSFSFCGVFVLFFQRDLLWSLVRNFDFLFSLSQTLVFAVCHCDLHGWDFERTLNVVTWSLWFFWALAMDAMTPMIKQRIFRFEKRFAAPVLASMIVGTGAIGLMVLLIPNLGLHRRDLWTVHFSSDAAFVIRTESLLLGRVVTILLWCSRQGFMLVTRTDDELNLIRGSVEYMSPYCTFPSLRTTTTAAIKQRASRSPSLTSPSGELLKRVVVRSAKALVGSRPVQPHPKPPPT